ncbi:MAG: AsmA family protein, partial [Bacteroidales bacterium]
MKRSGKIIFSVIAGFIIILVFAILFVPFLIKGKVNEAVKSEANKMLEASVNFSNIDTSLIKHFPEVTLALKDLSVKGVEEFSKDTLLAAKKVELTLDILSLTKSSGYEIMQIIINKPVIHARVLNNGKANWDILKRDTINAVHENHTSQKPSYTSFHLKIDKVKIDEAYLSYIDLEDMIGFECSQADILLSGDLSSEESTIVLKSGLQGIRYGNKDNVLINNIDLNFDGKIEADFNKKQFTFSNNKLSINALNLSLDGYIQSLDSCLQMDLKTTAPNVEVKEILSLVPQLYQREFKDITANGTTQFNGWIKGRLCKTQIPAFDFNASITDGSFKYKSLNQSIEDINLKLSMSNEEQGNGSGIIISVPTFNCLFANNKIDGNFRLTDPFYAMNFNLQTKGIFDLSRIKEVYPLKSDESYSGVVNADLIASGSIADIEKKDYKSIRANGQVSFKNVVAVAKNKPKFIIESGTIELLPSYASIDNISVKIADSDLRLSGKVENYLPYIFHNGVLKGSLNITSDNLNINQWMAANNDTIKAKSPDKKATSKANDPKVNVSPEPLQIPNNVDIAFIGKFNQILIEKLRINNLVGQVIIKDGILKLNGVKLDLFGGNVAGNGTFDTHIPNKPVLDMDMNMQNIVIKQLFDETQTAQSLAPVFANIKGQMDMQLKLQMDFNGSMQPILKSVESEGIIKTKNVVISDLKALNALAQALQNPSLNSINANDIVIPFRISDGSVYTKPFDIRFAGNTLTLSGKTTLNQEIDYTGKISIAEGISSKLGGLKTIPLIISGSFNDPKVQLNTQAMIDNAINEIFNKKISPVKSKDEVQQNADSI